MLKVGAVPSPSESLAKIASWEQEFEVDRWVVDGIFIWPLIRTIMGSALDHLRLPETSTNSRRAMLRIKPAMRRVTGVTNTACALWLDRQHNATWPAKASIDSVFLSVPSSRQPWSGGFFDIYCDPLIHVLSERSRRCLQLEYGPALSGYRIPRSSASRLIEPRVIWEEIKAATFGRIGRCQSSLQGFEEFCRQAAAFAPGISLPTHATLIARVRRIAALARYFEALLRWVRASNVFTVCYYSTVGMAMNLAASRAGVLTTDIQHGTHRGHFAADGFSRVPSTGYALLPDVFWCWTPAQAEIVARWADWEENRHVAIAGGHPWVAHLTDRSVDDVDAAVRAIEKIPQGRTGMQVLLALQWERRLTDLWKRVILEAPGEWFWWVRFHPTLGNQRSLVKSWLEEHVRGRYNVDEASDAPLPLLLEQCDTLLTSSSSTVLEAALTGTPAVFSSESGKDHFADEMSVGWARHADTADGIVAAIQEQIAVSKELDHRYRSPDRSHVLRSVDELLSIQRKFASTLV